MDETPHLSVLLEDVVDLLAVRPGGLYADGTLGWGGHAAAVVSRGGRVVGTDRDAEALAAARTRLGPEAELHHARFSALPALLAGRLADGILLDLGVSSPQLDRPERGFSFRLNGPLDMRMDPSSGESAAEWLARVGADELADVLYKYGEERQSRRVARAIIARRSVEPPEPLVTTRQLAELVASVVRAEGRIHPATRTFQGIRIAINDELGELERALAALPDCLAPGGRLVVISFHSLEDRAVKSAFRRLAGEDAPRDLYGNPVSTTPFRLVERRARRGDADVNPRARSARLRVLERIA
ncbi:ribosomal RNA small subunit methyltransferase H [Deltaproteobacteria bacterium]|nr:ribosomal RNA small subunit methyltransferase H [Deltaproteobacteria bacterium]